MLDVQTVVFILSLIAPGAERLNDAPKVAESIARYAETEDEAIKLAVMGYYESRFKGTITGDNGHAFGYLQLHNVEEQVGFDIDKSTLIARDRLRKSGERCPDFPIALYASGSCQRGRHVSNFRIWKIREVQKKFDSTKEL